ncbi:MAG: efflux RND transporter permease subunit, partial [Planctomycetota bacterium]
EAGRGKGVADIDQAMLLVRLYDKVDREKTLEQFQDAVRKACPDIEGAVFEFQSVGLESESTSAESAPIAIRIFGNEIDVLSELAHGVVERIKDVEGLKDLNINLKEEKPELRIYIDRIKAAQLGLSVPLIAATLETASLGKIASRLREKGEEVDIRVRLREEDRNTLEKIRSITITSPIGSNIPLSQVTRIELVKGPIEITRERQTRKVSILANNHERTVGAVVDDIKAKLHDYVLAFPPGYSIDYGGTYKDMQEANKDLLFALIISILLVYMVMAAQFESLSQPFVIMFTVPLGLIGVAIGLHAMQLSLSTPAFMGFIILGGIVVNNAIVMIDYINSLIREKKMSRHEAIIEGAAIRLRPILITSLTTVLGILPMGFSRSEGSEMRNPLGIAVGVGLLFSTFLTLFIIPAIYSLIGRVSIPDEKSSADTNKQQ